MVVPERGRRHHRRDGYKAKRYGNRSESIGVGAAWLSSCLVCQLTECDSVEVCRWCSRNVFRMLCWNSRAGEYLLTSIVTFGGRCVGGCRRSKSRDSEPRTGKLEIAVRLKKKSRPGRSEEAGWMHLVLSELSIRVKDCRSSGVCLGCWCGERRLSDRSRYKNWQAVVIEP